MDKSLSKSHKGLHVLAGPYALSAFVIRSGQLARGGELFHFAAIARGLTKKNASPIVAALKYLLNGVPLEVDSEHMLSRLAVVGHWLRWVHCDR